MQRMNVLFFLATFFAVAAFAGDIDETADAAALHTYAEAWQAGNIGAAPLNPDVSFFGPLLDQPITGKDAVTGFYRNVSAVIDAVHIERISAADDGGCIEALVTFKGRSAPLEEVHCLTVKDDLIMQIKLYFDPRPLLEVEGS